MSEQNAIVVEIEGRAWARTVDGRVRNLSEGDSLAVGERLVVERGASITLDVGAGEVLSYVGPLQLLLTSDFWSSSNTQPDTAVDSGASDVTPSVVNDETRQPSSNSSRVDDKESPVSQGWHYSVNLKRVGEELTPPGLDGSGVPERPSPPYTLGGRIMDGDDGPVPPLPPVPPPVPPEPPVPNFPPQTSDQYLTTPEDVALPGGIPGYDPEGAPLSYRIISEPSHGSVTLDPATGAFVYTPNEDYNGDDQFMVELSDGRYTVTETTYIEVIPVNDPPEATDQYLVTPEDTAIEGQLEASDVDGDSLTYRIATGPSFGEVTLDPNTGAFRYEPGPDYVGNDQFTVLVDDGEGGTTEAVVYIEVTPVSDSAVITGDDTGDLLEDSDDPMLRDNGKLEVVDPDQDEAVFLPGNAIAGAGALGQLTISADGAWEYQVANAEVQYLALGETVSETHTVSTADGTTHDVVVTITGVNDTPTITVATGDSDSAILSETDAALSATGTLSVADVDLADTVAPSVLSVSAAGPVDTLTNAQLLAMLSVDAGDIIALGAQNGVLNWQFNSGSTTFDFLPEGERLTLTYQVQVTDSEGATSAHDITVRITGTNDAPIFTGGTRGSVTEDASDPELRYEGQIQGYDPDGNESAIDDSIAPIPQGAVLGTMVIDAAGAWSYTVANADTQYLAQNQLLTERFLVTTVDGTQHPITVVIRGTNDAPEITLQTGDSDAASLQETNAGLMAEGTLSVVDIDVRDTVSASVVEVFSNIDGLLDDAVLLTMMNVDSANVINAGSINGVITWEFDSGAENFAVLPTDVPYILTYNVMVTDSAGAVDSKEVTVEIVGTNDAPVFTGGDRGAVKEDIDVQAGNRLLAADQLEGFDADYGEAEIVPTASADGLNNVRGSLSILADGSWNYTVDNADVQYLSDGQVAIDIFQVVTVDGATHAIAVRIMGTNDAPVISVGEADSDSATLSETDAGLIASGTLSVKDVDVHDSVTSSVAGVAVSSGDDGGIDIGVLADMLIIDDAAIIDRGETEGIIQWTFDSAREAFDYLGAGDELVLSYTVAVADNQGGVDDHQVNITITGRNDAPIITPAGIQDQLNQDFEAITAVDITSGFSDIDASDSLTYTATGLPLGLSISQAGLITGTLDNSASVDSPYTVSVTATDSQGAEVTTTFNWVVTNPAPDFINETTGVDNDTYEFEVYEGVVQGTATVAAADPDGDTLTYSILYGNNDGLFAINPNTGEMSVTRVVDDPDLGVRQLVVRVDDGEGGVDLGRVQVTLINVNDPPIVYPDTVQVNEDSTLNDRVPQATDVDSALDPTGFILQQDVSAGVLTFNADGSYLFATNGEFESLRQGQSTSVTFTYITTDTATDFDGNTVYSAPATITIDIQGVNDAPSFNGDDQLAVDEDANDPTITGSGTLLVTDSDDSESAIDAARAPTPSGGALGSLMIDSSGNWDYSVSNAALQYLAEGETYTETHTVYAVDGTSHDITVTITGVNDAPAISVAGSDRITASLAETNASLTTNGTVSVADVDLLDTVAPSVTAVNVVSGDANNMSSAMLLAMMSVSATEVIAEGAGNGIMNWQFSSPDDAFDYLPENDQVVLEYTLTATDSEGATDDQLVTITITGTNDVPDVFDGVAVTDEDTAVNGQVPAANDVDGTVTSYTTAGGPTLPAGLLTFGSDGRYTVNPAGSYDYLALGESEEFTFTYRAIDNDGEFSDFSQVTVTINGVDDAPVVSAGSGTVREDLVTTATGTLNAYDVDNPDLEFIADTYSSAYGTLTVNTDGTWSYQLNQNATVDAISLNENHQENYTVALNGDGRPETPLDNNLTTTVTINILGTNDNPEVPDLAFDVFENAVLIDGVSATDIDGTISSFGLVSNAGEGKLTFNAADGTFTFDTNGDFADLAAGAERDVVFTYSAVDNNGAVAVPGTVTITVVGVDNPAVIQNSSGAISEDASSDTVSGTLVARDVDDPTLAFGPDGNGQTLQGVYGSVVVAPDGSWTYTLDNAAQATDELDVGDQVTDVFAVDLSSDDGATAQLTINITGSNDAPVLTTEQITLSVNEQDTLNNQPLSAVTDVDADDRLDGYYLLDDSQFTPGSLIFNTNGTFSVDPRFQFDSLEDGDSEQVSFTYRAFDSHGAVSQIGTVTIDISGFSDGDGDVNSGEIIEVNVPSSVTGGPLDNYTQGTYDDSLGYGTLTVNPDGSWSYALDPSAADPLGPGDNVIVTIPSGSGGDSVTINIVGTNDAPVVEDVPCGVIATGENSVFTGAVPAGTDVDGSVVSYSAVDTSGLQGGTITFNDNGTFTFDPGTAFDPLDEGDEQQVSFTYHGIDNNGAISNTASVCITVIGEDDAPTVTTGSGAVIEDDPANNQASGQLSLQDVDEDDVAGGSVTFTPQTNVAGTYGTFTIDANGNWTYTLDNANPNTNALNVDEQVSETFTVDISNGSTTTVTVNVTGANDVPVIDSGDSNLAVSLDEDSLYNGTLPLATDVDSDGVVVAYVQQGGLLYVDDSSAAPGALTFYSDGSYTFDPRGSYDYLSDGASVDVSFTYRAEDNDSGLSSPATVTLTINGIDDLPVISSGSAAITEDDANPAASGQLDASDPDDGEDLTFVAGTYTGVYGSVILQADGSWQYNLAPNAQELMGGESFTDTIVVDLSEGNSTTIDITIKGINDVPTSADSVIDIDEDSVLNASVPEADDVDGNIVAYRLVDGSLSGPGTINFNSDGSYSYNPGSNFQYLDEGDIEPITFQYRVQDNNDGISDPITVTINVTGVNDAPTSSAVANQSSDEATMVNLDVSSSFSDVDADNVFTYTASGLPASLDINAATGVISGTLDADAAADSVYTITVTATDSGGESTSQSFTWTVLNPAPDFINEPSGADDDSYEFSADEGAVSGTELGVVSALDPDGDTLTYSITAGNSAGLFAIDATTGAITLTTDVDDDEIGVYSLSVYADDGQGGSDTANVNISLLNVNDSPVVSGGAISVQEESVNTPLGVATPKDADGDALTVTVTGLPDVGEVTLANGTVLALNDTFSGVELSGLLYNAPQELAADYIGAFEFSVDDGQGQANSVQTASVDIAVAAVNDAPVANDDVVDEVANNSPGIVIDVLANDTDAENDELTVFSATAESGTVTINADGTLNYVPSSGFIGTDNIIYQVNDSSGAFDFGNVSIAVVSGVSPAMAGAQPQPSAKAGFAMDDDGGLGADSLAWHLGDASANDQSAASNAMGAARPLGFADLLEDDDEDLTQWLPRDDESDDSVSELVLYVSAPSANADSPYGLSEDITPYSAVDTDSFELFINHTQGQIDL